MDEIAVAAYLCARPVNEGRAVVFCIHDIVQDAVEVCGVGQRQPQALDPGAEYVALPRLVESA